MRLALLGFGLIGGSVARAARIGRAVEWIAAWSPTGAGPARALAEGVVDVAAASAAAALGGADLVVLAAPPLGCLELLDRLAGPLAAALPAGATITDVASTKGAIVARADGLGLRFVGGHPMAGRETTGYGAATPDLFAGRPWIVVSGAVAEASDVRRVEALARACGARPVAMSAAEHDGATAAVSHLPLLVSAALVEAAAGSSEGLEATAWAGAAGLAAGGWDSATRLALGDPEMGAGIMATNAAAISARLGRLLDVLDRWRADLEDPEGPATGRILRRLETARRLLEEASPDGESGPPAAGDSER